MTMRIGVDLGGTKTEGVALDGSGQIIFRERVDSAQGDYQGTMETIATLVERIETETGQRGTVGVGIPGTIVRETGLVKNANSTWLNGQPLEKDLSARLAREVRCANDANCFAVSEATDGAARDYNTVFGVILGTGCGGGVAIGKKVHSGRNAVAGEWGHTPLPWMREDEFPGPDCYCGLRGCLELWISGTGFEADYERVNKTRMRGREIVAAAAQGETAAVEAIDRLIDRIARGLSTVVNVLDPDVFVLGGGLSQMDALYDGRLCAKLASYTFGKQMMTPVVRNQHGDSSGVRGAAWLWPA